MIHIALHFIVPLAVAWAAYWVGAQWGQQIHPWRAFAVMAATMAIDLDHLLANPIYDPNRCSIGFHPLHEPALIFLYVALLLPRATRWVGIGILIHLSLDSIDCQVTNGVWLHTPT